MKIFLFISILLTLKSTGFTQEQWKLNRDENGIKVYTSSLQSSKFKAIKVEAVLPGTIHDLAGVLMDVSNNKKWVYNTTHSFLLKKVSQNELIYYAETHLPWPLQNRDMAIRMVFNIDTLHNTLKVEAAGEPDALPEKKGVVRIRYFKAKWDVKNIDKNKVMVRYYLNLNPGGSITPGLTNMFVAKGPYETFNNLGNLLKTRTGK